MNGRRAIALVARREIVERLRSRAFLISTVVMLLLVAASVGLGGFLSKETTYRFAAVAPVPADLEAALDRAADPFDARARLDVVPSPAAGRETLEAEDADALLILPQDRLVFRADVDPQLAAVADTAVRAVRRHLPPAPELSVVSLEPGEAEHTDAEVLVAAGGSLLLVVLLAVYGQSVIASVVEERSSRVVELVLSTVRARHLLAGKVVGIGILGLAQLTLIAGLAAVLLAAGAFDAPAELGGSLALVIPWFVLGFALYAVAYAVAGALASRQDGPDAAGQPVSYALAAAYFVGYVVVSADAEGAAAHALTILPLTAPLVLPARSALVGVPAWEHALALVLVLATIVALVRFAGRVYAHGVLHAGPAIGIRDALRLSRRS